MSKSTITLKIPETTKLKKNYSNWKDNNKVLQLNYHTKKNRLKGSQIRYDGAMMNEKTFIVGLGREWDNLVYWKRLGW